MNLRHSIFCLLAAALCFHALAGEVKPPVKKESKSSRVDNMDFGPFVSLTLWKINGPDSGAQYGTKDGIALKGIVVKLGGKSQACVCFDTDTMRYAVGWTGGFIDWSRTNTGQYKGDDPASGIGTARFGTKDGPGVGLSGVFKDSRKKGVGPLDYEDAKYNGLYLNSNKVIFSYSVGGVNVLETPSLLESESGSAFVRTLSIAPSKRELNFVLCESAPGLHALLSKTPSNVTLSSNNGREILTVRARENAVAFNVAVCTATDKSLTADFNALDAADLPVLIKGGAPRWPQTIETQGILGTGAGPYVIDNITLPEINPWNSWIRATAFDFFSDGKRSAVSTLSGDVWIVSGIDDGLKKLVWKRFATGLYEPLGLKIVDDVVYVLGRDQITRLIDLKGEGEADYYENFCSQWNISPSYHAFSFDLWTDKDGNFYFVNDGNQVEIGLPGHGVMFKISKDGKKIEEIASGLRAPNGMAVGPNGEIVCSDNQGFWMPSSKINWVKPGMFLGFPGDPRKQTATNKYVVPPTYDQPLCWIPYPYDNSSGGEAFITSDKWGPFKNKLVHLSYGKCTLLIVTTEDVDGQMQGGSMRLPLVFPSGVMRARFDSQDGQLYVCGMKGWQTSAAKDGCFSRVRYTGAPVNMPLEVKTHPRGIDITFTCPLDEAAAKDTSNYALEQWGYLWSPAYGSADYKVSNPKEIGRDTIEVEYVNLSADKRTISIALKDVKPVMQLGIKMKLKAADGSPINHELDYTINKVGR